MKPNKNKAPSFFVIFLLIFVYTTIIYGLILVWEYGDEQVLKESNIIVPKQLGTYYSLEDNFVIIVTNGEQIIEFNRKNEEERRQVCVVR